MDTLDDKQLADRLAQRNIIRQSLDGWQMLARAADFRDDLAVVSGQLWQNTANGIARAHPSATRRL
jgi:hypothetical protein